MTPSPELIDHLLANNSAEAARSSLIDTGYSISIHRLHTRLAQLISQGKRKPIAQTDREFHGGAHYEIPKGSSLEGSEKLLDACLSLYRRRAAEVGVSVQDAMLFMLNAPERLGV